MEIKMALLAPNEGEVKILSVALGKDAAENLNLRLFTNDYTPVEATTASDFTEATGYGYAAISCIPADWTVTAGDPSVAVTADKVFTFTGALGNVYGYYLTGATSGKVYWAERFTSTPVNVQYNNSQIRIPTQVGLS